MLAVKLKKSTQQIMIPDSSHNFPAQKLLTKHTVFAAQKSAAFHTNSNLWATHCIEICRNAYSLQKCSVSK